MGASSTRRQLQKNLLPAGRRAREKAAGSFFRASTRLVGLRPELIPAHMRQQVRLIGVDDAQLARVLRNIRSLADWPYAWEAEGDRYAAAGDWHNAVSIYYLAQRPLLTGTALKRRLYGLVLDAYERAGYTPPLEHLRVRSSLGETIAGYLQVPATPREGGLPLVVMVPGVTATKEELHVYSQPLTRRGYAVARIDSPGYGQTTGRLTDGAQSNVSDVVRHLASDARIDASRIHLFGMSLGAHLALNGATECNDLLASITVIAPALEAESFLADLPTSNLTAISHMMGTDDWQEMLRLARVYGLGERARAITVPVRVFHGGRDRTIPVEQSWKLVDALGGPAAVTIFERDHHNCLEHHEEIVAEMLEWLRDPAPALDRFAREQRERLHQARSGAAVDSTSETVLPGADPAAEPGLA